MTLRELQATCFTDPAPTARPPSKPTVAKALRRGGLRSRCTIGKPLLTKDNRKARLEWARAHEHWADADWNCCIFSDELRITLLGLGTRHRV